MDGGNEPEGQGCGGHEFCRSRGFCATCNWEKMNAYIDDLLLKADTTPNITEFKITHNGATDSEKVLANMSRRGLVNHVS